MKKIIMFLLIVAAFLALGMRATRNQPTALAYYAADTASNDSYLAQVNGISGYTTGLFVLLNPATDNTGACTLNINGLGARPLVILTGADPVNSYIDHLQIVPLGYDIDNSQFIILSPDANP